MSSGPRFPVPYPRGFVALMLGIGLLMGFILLSWIGVIPIRNLFVYMVSVAIFWTLITMFAILGGVAIAIDALDNDDRYYCLLYTSPSPRDRTRSRMPSSA